MSLRLVAPGAEPLRGLIGVAGPSSSGKTFSALRMAVGMQEILQKPIAMIDTELRGNLYEKRFQFDRFVMEPPFSTKAWMDAFKELDGKYGIIISDNFSDEYEGQGGLAELASRSTAKSDVAKWAEPKAQHKELMNKIRLLKSQHLFLLRASDKIEIIEGEDPVTGRVKKLVRSKGWQPIAEKNFAYDITFGWMLPPGCRGCGQVLKSIDGMPFGDGEELSEEHGRMIARWTLGLPITQSHEEPMLEIVKILKADGSALYTGTILREALTAYKKVKDAAPDKTAVAVANLPALKEGVLPYPPRVTGDPHRVTIQVLACRRLPDRKGPARDAFTILYRGRIVQGFGCPLEIDWHWSSKYVAFRASRPDGFGFKRPKFNKPQTGRPYQQYSTLVGMRFAADLSVTADGKKVLDDVRCGQSLQEYNRALTEMRYRSTFDCPMEYTHPCHHCHKGQESCPAACHPQDYVTKVCSACGQESEHDEYWGFGVCTRCMASGKRQFP